VRGLLIVNPQATSTSPRVTEVIIAALSATANKVTSIDVVSTEHRGHARELGARASADGVDLVITLGGDGTINEVVNGMLGSDPSRIPVASTVPVLATVPGGSANVFARALGFSADPVEATGEILAGISAGYTHTLGLGTVTFNDERRWFLANAGVGLDAEIIAAMEGQRKQGYTATPMRYLRTTLRQYFMATDRREPALSLLRGGDEEINDVFVAIVQNTSPWTYLGSLPVDACPHASFDSDLDVFALRRMGLTAALRAGGRLLANSQAGSTRRSIAVWHDQRAFTVRARRPTPLQVDGENMGVVDQADFSAHPGAIRAIAPMEQP